MLPLGEVKDVDHILSRVRYRETDKISVIQLEKIWSGAVRCQACPGIRGMSRKLPELAVVNPEDARFNDRHSTLRYLRTQLSPGHVSNCSELWSIWGWIGSRSKWSDIYDLEKTKTFLQEF